MVQWKQRFRFWLGGLSPLPFAVVLSILIGLLILYACRDSSEITQPYEHLSSKTAMSTARVQEWLGRLMA